MSFSQPLYQLRGTALKPYYSTGSSEIITVRAQANSVAASIDTNNTTGVFGNSVINCSSLTASNNGRNLKASMARGNAPSTGAFSVLIRIVPQWSGNPGTAQSLVQIGDPFGGGPAINIRITTASKIYVEVDNEQNSSVVAFTSTASFSFTNGTPTDIMVTWDGTAAASSVKLYQDGTLVESDNPAAAVGRWDQAILQTLQIGADYQTNNHNTLFTINEFCIFDSVQAAYSPRSGFVASSNLNGDTLPAVSDVRSGTVVGLNTGTCIVPARTDVRAGTAVDNTTGTLAVPSAANVRNGVSVDNTVGNLIVPAASNVAAGVAYDSNGSVIGTLQAVTNVLQAPALVGPNLSATLVQT